jgi:hypothetical protein
VRFTNEPPIVVQPNDVTDLDPIVAHGMIVENRHVADAPVITGTAAAKQVNVQRAPTLMKSSNTAPKAQSVPYTTRSGRRVNKPYRYRH